MNSDTHRMLDALQGAGISSIDAWELRRIAMALHRWFELECGIDGGAIERDEKTGKPFFYSPGSIVLPDRRWPIADREKGALKRLIKLMARYPTLSYYIQTDPRGASLYILRPGDVPEGKEADGYYSRGIAVFK